MQFSWRWSGVPWMIAGGADRIQSGSSTNPNPLEYGGSGPERKGAVSCWDAESGLEVMGRREKKEPCLWHGTKWITAIFLLLCLTVRVESGGPDNKGTEPQTQAKLSAQEKKSCLVELISCHLWIFGWTYDEVIHVSVLMSAQTVKQSGGNDWKTSLYFLAPTLLFNGGGISLFSPSGVFQHSWTRVIKNE